MAGGESSRTPRRAPGSLETFLDLLDEIHPELGWHGIGLAQSHRADESHLRVVRDGTKRLAVHESAGVTYHPNTYTDMPR
jgi:hypothetical protein